MRSLPAALGSVRDPGLSLFLTHFPKVSSSLAMNVTSRPEKTLQLPSMASQHGSCRGSPNTHNFAGVGGQRQEKKSCFSNGFLLRS